MKRSFFKLLEQWKSRKNRKQLIVKGVRQLGKTYILKKFGASFPACHYVNFEKDPELSKIFEKNLERKTLK